jgi:all-trans-8'-apo-beta-carotenal 15,15'-oxygenase
MISNPTQTEKPLWYGAIASPAEEFAATPLTILEGKIPENLTGTLYRNGPARFSRGGASVDHWFDGDGAILAVRFGESQAVGTYRYVNTKEFEEETKAETLLYGGYGTLPAVGLWNRFQKTIKNAANTSVLPLPDRLLALWEGGKPHALDLATLETIGLDCLGALDDEQTFSAHPKQDPQSGEIYNFGVGLGRQGKLFVYRCDRQGHMLKQLTLPLKGIPLIHDFAMAGPYLVFCISPVLLQNPLKILVGLQSYSDCLRWKPQKGTQLLILDRETLEVVNQGEAEPWFQWHFGNGYVSDSGNIVLTLSRYEDFQTNQFLKEVMTGETQTIAKAKLWQCEIHPQSMALISSQTLVGQVSEFPTVSPLAVGFKAKSTYFSCNHPSLETAGLLKDIGCFNHKTDQVQTSQLPSTHYPTEPLFAPNPNNPDQGWILTVVYDGDRHQSEVWIYEDNCLEHPVCRISLPSFIPIGFHGKWHSA